MLMMQLLNILSSTLFTTAIISPLPNEYSAPTIYIPQIVSPLPPQLVLGVHTQETEILPTITLSPSVITPTQPAQPAYTPRPTPLPKTLKKSYTIAFLGDSMIDTLGPKLPHLASLLTQNYPNVSFTLINHGIGATTIETGKNHLTNSFTKNDQQIQAILSDPPDILVVESFAYNPISPVEKHTLALREIVDTVHSKSSNTKIIFVTAIAPDSANFAKGAPGILFTEKERTEYVQTIIKLLENTRSYAQSQNIPLADAYTPSKNDGKGVTAYINQTDHIHYSEQGKSFISQIIFNTLQKNNLF